MLEEFNVIHENLIETPPAVVQWEDPFVRITMAENMFMDEKEVDYIIAAMEKLSNGRVYGTLVINQNIGEVSRGARAKSARYRPQNLAATAIINTNTIAGLAINFYLKVSKPKIPNRIFKNEDDAKEWLLDMIELHKEKLL